MATRAVGNPFTKKKAAPKAAATATKTVAKNPFARGKKVAPVAKAGKKAAPKGAATKSVANNPFARGKKVAPAAKAKAGKKAPAAKAGKKAAVTANSAPPASKGYPSIAKEMSSIKFNFSGGGNKAPGSPYPVPNFADPRLQIERDPAFYAAAAKTRKSAFSGNNEYAFEDGLTVIERQQKATIPGFLSGSARSQIDKSAIRDDLVADQLIFGLDPDRFQLLFIAVFGLFALIGGLSGNLNF